MIFVDKYPRTVVGLSFILGILLGVLCFTPREDRTNNTDFLSINDVSKESVLDTKECEHQFNDLELKDLLLQELIDNDVLYPEIVYTQAVLETGWFKSNLCVNNHNLFGLYNARKKEFYKFDSWDKSIAAYKQWIQYKYKKGEDYYDFLLRIGYAEDPEYINKLKNIHNRIFNGN